MIRGSCPICSGPFEIASLDDLPSFPFCSQRCKQIDLGRWLRGSYAIPGAAVDRRNEDDQTSDEPGKAAPATDEPE